MNKPNVRVPDWCADAMVSLQGLAIILLGTLPLKVIGVIDQAWSGVFLGSISAAIGLFVALRLYAVVDNFNKN